MLLLLLTTCKPDLSDDPIPAAFFDDISINLNLPAYNALKSNGGYMYLSEGVRGIILYRKNETTYLAFERNCSYKPNQACSTVEVHSSGLYMTDPCCQSIFNFETGDATGGPAWRPLLQYTTALQGSMLVIKDEPINY